MIKVIVCGWQCDSYLKKCLSSIDMQSYKKYTRTIVIDGDGEDRRYLVKNTIEAITYAEPEDNDIIVCVDADDFLIDEDAFKIIVRAYDDNPELLLTYGSYVNMSSNMPGKFSGGYEYGVDFRTADWRGSHLKTFKYRLWKTLPMMQLQDDKGDWFKCCADRAMMVPMMELAGHDRIKYIDTLLYCYNDCNPISVWKTNRNLSINTRKTISERKPLNRLAKI